MQSKLTLLAAFFCLAFAASAQTEDSSNNADQSFKRNFVKTNITSIFLKNYSLQYERVLSKRVSVALTYRTMPTTSIPFKSTVLDAIGDGDDDTKDIINQTKLSNFAITPEVRFYLGKGYGKGFYVAPYYRYVSFSTNQVPVHYDGANGSRQAVNLSGDLKANTGGILFGAQWLLGRHFCLDWWILGAHYGSGKGNFTGTPGAPLTIDEQHQIESDLNDIDIPLTDKTVSVSANNVSVLLDGSFGGLRGGLSFGFRF